MKFSIIIPVYNVESYLRRCLDSVMNQSYNNYEVIIVNDGSLDDSQKIIDEYCKKNDNFYSFKKQNGGLSDARNYGIKKVMGDYILFLDSDDYIDCKLLETVKKSIDENNQPDVIKYKINLVDDNNNLIRREKGYDFSSFVDFETIINLEFCEPAWSYFFKSDFFLNNKFLFEKGRVHEDFGLVPYILIKANRIYYLPFYGYNYVQRKGSITSSNNIDKIIKKCYDTLYFYDLNIKLIEKDKSIPEKDKKIILSFYSNAVISRGKNLTKNNLKKYCEELYKRNVVDNILDNSMMRKVKKMLMKANLRLYIKFIG